jgi:hypothetical protein
MRRITRLRQLVSRWTQRQRKLQDRAGDAELQPQIRKLERRRVLAANPLFAGGVLTLNFDSGSTASLLVTGTDFFVDENGNSAFNGGELKSALAGLDKIAITTSDGTGTFNWVGDFSASFNTAFGGGADTISITGIDDVTINAAYNALDDVVITGIDNNVVLGDVQDVDGDLSIDADGTITDLSTASLNVDLSATLDADGGITLNDEATNSLTVTGLASFISLGDINVGSAGTAKFGQLDVSGSALTFQVDQDVVIEDIAGKSLSLTVTGTITDVDTVDQSSIQITNDATFIATSDITLADTLNDNFDVGGDAYFQTAGAKSIVIGTAGAADFGSLGLSGGTATVQEDSATDLDGVNVTTLSITSTAGITQTGTDTGAGSGDIIVGGNADFFAADNITLADAVGKNIAVTGEAYFETLGTKNIVIGTLGTANFGSVGLKALSATVQEDSATALDGVAVTTLSITSTAGITQTGTDTGAGSGTITVTGNADFFAADNITLADAVGKNIAVTGEAYFETLGTKNIVIGTLGTANFGSVGLKALSATVQEDSATVLDGIAVTTLSITSTAGITQTGTDTGAGSGDITVTGNADFFAADAITLADAAGKNIAVTGEAYFETLGTKNIVIGTLGTANFGSVGLKALSATVQEDSATALDGVSVTTLSITSTAGITQTGTDTGAGSGDITVTGNADFFAADTITLADAAGKNIAVTGEAYFETLGTKNIVIGTLGTANFGSVGLKALSATVQEDSATALDGVAVTTLSITSTAGITQTGTDTGAGSGDITVTGNADFFAADAITLADAAGKNIAVTGEAYFETLGTKNIVIGTLGDANFGSVGLKALSATVQEDSATILDGVAVTTLSITSTAGITQTGTDTGAGSGDITVTGNADFFAADAITLADAVGKNISVTGEAYFETLLTKNIVIGTLGDANFGSVGLKALSATVQEDSATALDGVAVTTLAITSTAGITQTGTDTGAGSTGIVVGGDADFFAADNITLADAAGRDISVTGDAYFETLATKDIVIGTLGTANFGSIGLKALTATVQEDSATDLDGISVTTLSITSTAGITQTALDTGAGTADIVATGNADFFAADNITLADAVGDNITVTGEAYFETLGTKNIVIGTLGTANFGSVGLKGLAATVQEDSATILDGVAVTTLSITSTAGITQTGTDTGAGSGTITATGNADFFATENITLADAAGKNIAVTGEAYFETLLTKNVVIGTAGTADFGSLGLKALSATVQEDSATALDGVAVTTLSITSAGGITQTGIDTGAGSGDITVTGNADFFAADNITLADAAGKNIAVTGEAYFETLGTKNITIGTAGTANFGSIGLKGGTVTVQEDSATDLDGINATNLSITSTAGIIQTGTDTGAGSGDIIVSGTADFFAADDITLADAVGKNIAVTGEAYFETGGAKNITIGSLGDANFGSLGLKGAIATVQEDSATHLDGSSLTTLNLTSAGNLVTQSGSDTGAGTGALEITGATNITLSPATGSVELLRASSAPAGTTNDGALVDNVLGGTITLVGADTAVRLRNTGAGALSAIPTTLSDDLELWFTQQSIALPGATMTIGGDVLLVAGVDVDGGGKLTVLSSATADITDGATKLTVSGNATFIAADQVTLADAGGETLAVTKQANFVSRGGSAVVVGTGGDFTSGSLGFISSTSDNSVQGAVTITADSNTTLANVTLPFPDSQSLASRAGSLTLNVTGTLTDADVTSIQISGDADVFATDDITLANKAGDNLDVGGDAYFQTSLAKAIVIGTAGDADFGSLGLKALSATVQEDSGTDLDGVSVTTLSITSTAGITQTGVDTGAGTADISVAGNASFFAGDDITLANAVGKNISVTGDAYFETTAAKSILIGTDGLANFGSLGLKGGTATVQEDSSTDLDGISVGTLSITSTAGITQTGNDTGAGTGDITVTGNADFFAADNITLADAAGKNIAITGEAYFQTLGTKNIVIGTAGDANFGSVGLKALSATVQEDSATSLDGVAVTTLSITSTAGITQTGTDTGAGSGVITATGNADFFAVDDITLADAVGKNIAITGEAYFETTKNIVIGTAGDANFGSVGLKALSATVQEDSATVVDGVAVTTLSITSAAGITQSGTDTGAGSGDVTVTGNADFFAADDITLADTAGKNIAVTGEAYFETLGTKNIVIGTLGDANFGSVGLKALSATVQEDSATALDGVAVTTLSITSTAGITQTGTNTGAGSGDITVTGNADFFAADAITLADAAGKNIAVTGEAYFETLLTKSIVIGTAGDANFGSVGLKALSATVQEDSATALDGVAVTTLAVTSTAGITQTGTDSGAGSGDITVTGNADFFAADNITLADAAGKNISVTGEAYFETLLTKSITVGTAGDANFGSVGLKALAATVQEDSATDLDGIAVTTLSITSTAGITQTGTDTGAGSGDITVTGNADFFAADAITLANAAGKNIAVTGEAYFETLLTKSITVGTLGTANFGSVGLKALVATVQEDSATVLDGVAVTTLAITSTAGITQTGTDTGAGSGDITVTGNADFFASDNITLADAAGKNIAVTGEAYFETLATKNIVIGTAGDANFGSVGLKALAATVQEDSATVLDGVNVTTLSVTSTDTITQTGTDTGAGSGDILVSGDADFVAAKDITLANVAGRNISVGNEAFLQSATNVTVGTAGTANFGSVGLKAVVANVQEDSDTALDGVDVTTLIISSTAGITQTGSDTGAGTTSIDVAGAATFTATNDITFTDAVGKNIDVTGATSFTAANLNVAAPGTATFGDVSLAITGNATIFEDANITVAGATVGSKMTLRTAGNTIRNANPLAPAAIKATAATLEATTIHLDNVNFDQISAKTTGNAAVFVGAENAAAETSAKATLTKFAGHLPAADFDQLDETFVFTARFAGNYGLYIRDTDDGLEVVQDAALSLAGNDGILAEDGNIYLETQDADVVADANDNITLAAATDISVNHNVALTSAQRAQANGIVLVAQDNVVFGAGSNLVSKFTLGGTAVTTNVNSAALNATAFDGGDGVGLFDSTKFVNQTTSQNGKTSQAVVAQFGAAGETGFIAAVSYADDVVELFELGDATDLVLANDTGLTLGGFTPGVIADIVTTSNFGAAEPIPTATGADAIAFVRSDFFDDSFLAKEVILPTEIAIRRASDFHLFEGGNDVNTSLTELNSKSLDVEGVFTGQGTFAVPETNAVDRAAPPAPPETPAPLEIVNNPTTFIEFDDARPLTFNVIRVFITQINGWEDLNMDGAPYPSAEELAALEEGLVDKSGQAVKDLKLEYSVDENNGNVVRDEKGQEFNEELIEEWEKEYQDDPNKARGAYLIQMEDRFRGVTTKAIFRATPPDADDTSFVAPPESLQIVDLPEVGEPNLDSDVPVEDADIETTLLLPTQNEVEANSPEPISSAVLPGVIGAGLWLQRRRQRGEPVVGATAVTRRRRRRFRSV